MNDTVIELNDELNERKWDIKENLLIYCQKAVRVESGDPVDFIKTYYVIADRFEKCAENHKSLVDTINTIKNNNK